ncbi:16S rRNA (guanine(966)-N(2))-methyltransferase RsmD [Curtobacterium ammoniigenes]|uniref:16S rRNA (guanine(966)-N(2))-methyltransferase RsmD n=1 Tax=Curtobacterium ammoniigenes TaxID=395387 RepID=UPI000829DB08|nr:16S rRNA (guanine(966)-N(2))-methyltransferase RsmD [Curtobacterium ammoniigenes]
MTRIIAGAAGSLTLRVPRSGTRPTSDRVREAIFSSLEARDLLDGAAVLDLFAGTGALGLEAASRGAAEVTLVDGAAAAVAVCRQNAHAVTGRLGDAASIAVVGQPAAAYLRTTTRMFDLVFIDPPYEGTAAELDAVLAALAAHLTPDALVVVERAKRSPEPGWPSSLERVARRAYGETIVWEARPASP